MLEILTGIAGLSSGSTLSLTGVRASVGVPIAASTSFLASMARLITNEYFFKIKNQIYKSQRSCQHDNTSIRKDSKQVDD